MNICYEMNSFTISKALF